MNNIQKHAPKIVFVTFLNDYSGSPHILSIVIKEFVKRAYPIEVITNQSKGFLSGLKGVKYNYVYYKWTKRRWISLFFFLGVQIQLFFKVLFYSRKDVVFYINTVTPIGAVWACKLTRKEFVYHVHENILQKKPLYSLYRWTYKLCNVKTIFVSEYLKSQTPEVKNFRVIYNSLSRSFLEESQHYRSLHKQKGQTILMVASLRVFKGVYEFVDLAKRLPQYSFVLVLNAAEKEVDEFRQETTAPENIIIHAVTSDLHPFYQNARLLLQLSHPGGWIETFGLTILEAMVYGVPAIVPPIGGPLELVEDGVNGYTTDPRDTSLLVDKVRILMEDDALYESFAEAALVKSEQFNLDLMIDQIEEYVLE